MSDIELANVSKHNCLGIHLKIASGELFTIVGTTGAGKTTLLNVIAGVVGYAGSVIIDGVNVDRMPPRKRGVGYLVQDLALFPHLTVAANIAFGLEAGGCGRAAAAGRVASLMDMMRIRHLASRYPHMLSGGERKRVALARSLAPSPRILLLDEPTSSLDNQTAKYLRSELHSFLKALGITTVYVTHDLREAEEIADRIALMQNGRIEQVSTPANLFFSPSSESVSEFIGMPNILECKQSRVLASGLLEIVSGNDLRMIVPYDGDHIRKVAIPPDAIYISDAQLPGYGLNRYRGKVQQITRYNGMVRIRLSVDGESLLSELPAGAFEELAAREGEAVHVGINLGRLRYVAA